MEESELREGAVGGKSRVEAHKHCWGWQWEEETVEPGRLEYPYWSYYSKAPQLANGLQISSDESDETDCPTNKKP